MPTSIDDLESDSGGGGTADIESDSGGRAAVPAQFQSDHQWARPCLDVVGIYKPYKQALLSH